LRLTFALRGPTLWKPFDNWRAGDFLLIKAEVKIAMGLVTYPSPVATSARSVGRGGAAQAWVAEEYECNTHGTCALRRYSQPAGSAAGQL